MCSDRIEKNRPRYNDCKSRNKLKASNAKHFWSIQVTGYQYRQEAVLWSLLGAVLGSGLTMLTIQPPMLVVNPDPVSHLNTASQE